VAKKESKEDGAARTSQEPTPLGAPLSHTGVAPLVTPLTRFSMLRESFPLLQQLDNPQRKQRCQSGQESRLTTKHIRIKTVESNSGNKKTTPSITPCKILDHRLASESSGRHKDKSSLAFTQVSEVALLRR